MLTGLAFVVIVGGAKQSRVRRHCDRDCRVAALLTTTGKASHPIALGVDCAVIDSVASFRLAWLPANFVCSDAEGTAWPFTRNSVRSRATSPRRVWRDGSNWTASIGATRRPAHRATGLVSTGMSP